MARCMYVKPKSGHSYYVYQRRVPTPLVNLIGKTTWYQSLKTEDREMAHRRGLEIDAVVEKEIARAYRILERKPLDGDEISKLGAVHFERTNSYLDDLSSRIAGDDEAILRRAMPPVSDATSLDDFIAWANSDEGDGPYEPDPVVMQRAARERLAILLAHLRYGDFSPVQTFTDHEFERLGLVESRVDNDGCEVLDIDRTKPDYVSLARELMEKEIASVKRQLVQLAKAQVGYIDAPTKILVQPFADQSVPSELHPDAAKTPTALLPRFFRDNMNIGTSSQNSFSTALKRLEEVTGSKPVALISRNDVIDFFELERVCPVKFKTMLGAKTMKEAIALNADGAVPVLDAPTIAKHLSHLRKFFDWSRRFNLIAANPVGDLKIEHGGKDVANGEDKAFSIDELKAIFSQPHFTALPGKRTYRFWVPLVALWLGARMNEVCRLAVSDVQSANGVDWVMVTDSKAKGKSRGRKYPVPVHPELQRIGFMDYVQAMRACGEEKLFSDVPIGAANRNAYQPVSQWFGRFLKGCGLKRPGVAMHGFRHSFIGATRDSDISASMSEALVGHKSGSTSVHKGYGGGVSVEALAEVMPKLVFRGLDLSHLYVK